MKQIRQHNHAITSSQAKPLHKRVESIICTSNNTKTNRPQTIPKQIGRYGDVFREVALIDVLIRKLIRRGNELKERHHGAVGGLAFAEVRGFSAPNLRRLQILANPPRTLLLPPFPVLCLGGVVGASTASQAAAGWPVECES
jgi:hypothetical protein